MSLGRRKQAAGGCARAAQPGGHHGREADGAVAPIAPCARVDAAAGRRFAPTASASGSRAPADGVRCGVKASRINADVAYVPIGGELGHRARRWLATGACVLALSPLLVPTAADAESAAQAQREAAAIAAQVQALQPQVTAALAAYEAALDGVARSVSATVADRRVYEALQAQADQAAATYAAGIAALYEAGGPLGIYAALLTTGVPPDLRHLPYVSGVLSRQAAWAETTRQFASAAKQRLDADEASIDTELDNAATIQQRYLVLQGLLDRAQAILDAATARARALAAWESAAAALAAVRVAADQAGVDAAANAVAEPIPDAYRAWYQAAAKTCPGLPWQVLAAIGQVESHHGQGTMVSAAGALGPMQFLPATFARYATDGNGDGKADIWNPADAIFTAARYLCANGAGQGEAGLHAALWNYNHAEWYVQLVLAIAAKIR